MSASSLELVVSYADQNNFIYDAALIDFAGTTCQLKDLTPEHSTFFDSFDDENDANWGNGTLSRDLEGAASVDGSLLDLTGGTVAYVDYDANQNADFQQAGAVRLVYTPNYSGAPGADRYLFSICEADGVSRNEIYIRHAGGGGLYVNVSDSSGADIVSFSSGWSPTAGVSYEFELNFDVSAGATRLFIDGAQEGSTATDTGTRDANIGLFRVGSNCSGLEAADGKVDSIVCFSSVQHTANYASGAAISATRYSVANPTVVPISSVAADALEDLEETTASTPVGTALRHAIVTSGQDRYWAGTEWDTSDGLYSQSNTAEDISLNASSLDITSGTSLKFKTFLHSETGASTPVIGVQTLGYNFYNTLSSPETCTVWGFYRDVSGTGVAGATVEIALKREPKTQYREAGGSIIEKKATLTTDDDGRFEADLVRSSEYEGGGVYVLSISKSADSLLTKQISAGASIEFSVPDLADVNITSLVTAL